VTAIPAHFIAQQAAADPDFELSVHVFRPPGYNMWIINLLFVLADICDKKQPLVQSPAGKF
jgi:hypothetical protein